MDHLSGFQLLLLQWILGLTKRCYQKQYFEICYSTCCVYLFSLYIPCPSGKKFLLRLNESKSFPLPEDLGGEGRNHIYFFTSGWAGPSEVPDTYLAYTCRMNGFRGLCNQSRLLLGFGCQETRSQVVGTLVPCCWLGFPLSDPWSQAVSLTGLLRRTHEVKDPCLGRIWQVGDVGRQCSVWFFLPFSNGLIGQCWDFLSAVIFNFSVCKDHLSTVLKI